MVTQTTIQENLSKVYDDLIATGRRNIDTTQEILSHSLKGFNDLFYSIQQANLLFLNRQASRSFTIADASLRLGQHLFNGKVFSPDGSLSSETRKSVTDVLEASQGMTKDVAEWAECAENCQGNTIKELSDIQTQALKAGQRFFEAVCQCGETLSGLWQKAVVGAIPISSRETAGFGEEVPSARPKKRAA